MTLKVGDRVIRHTQEYPPRYWQRGVGWVGEDGPITACTEQERRTLALPADDSAWRQVRIGYIDEGRWGDCEP